MLSKAKPLIRKLLGNSKPYLIAAEVRRSIANYHKMDRRIITLMPSGPLRGIVLLSYILDTFFLKPDDPLHLTHTHYWETQQIAQSWLDLGYAVDVIHWTNSHFTPKKHYDFFIDVRQNMERIGPLLNADCVKIMHIETAHWLFHMTAQYKRLYDVQQRRNATISPHKIVAPNLAIENADCGTILGNEFTRSTYAYANKPLFRVPISVPVIYPWPEKKNFESCRRNFLWFGSSGLVHKGLDLVLEAFKDMPGFMLTVCGPINGEREFEDVFRQELYHTPNINTVGWVDVKSSYFTDIANNCIGIVYPSCSEGGGGGVITCLHAGLIPLVSYETSIDVENYGFLLKESSIEGIKACIQMVANLSAEDLAFRSRKAWEYARENHTRENFADVYRKTIEEIIKIYKH